MRRPKGSRRYGAWFVILKMDPIGSTYTDTESDKTQLHDFETLVCLSGVLMYRIIKQFDRAKWEVFQQLKSLKVTQKATPVFLVPMHLDCFFFHLLFGYKECRELFWTRFCDRDKIHLAWSLKLSPAFSHLDVLWGWIAWTSKLWRDGCESFQHSQGVTDRWKVFFVGGWWWNVLGC